MGSFFVMKQEGIQPTPGSKVIKAAQYADFVQASDLLHRARHEANAIEAKAQIAFHEARRKGYNAGVEEGKASVADHMMQVVSQTVNYLGDFEDSVTATVLAALNKIVGELDADDMIVRIIRNALRVVREQNRVTVRVSAKQVALVQRNLEQITAPYPGIRFIDVVPDLNLEPGDCVLESDMGSVEAGIESQLQVIRTALGRCFKRGTTAVDRQMEAIERSLVATAKSKPAKNRLIG